MKRRWKWIILGSAIPILGIGGLWLALTSTAPSAYAPTSARQRDIPSDWLVATSADNDPETSSRVPDSPAPETRGKLSSVGEPSPSESLSSRRETPFETAGTLAYLRGKAAFGDEAYRLSIDDSGIMLESTGQFRFKVLVTTIRVAIEQELQIDREGRPTRFSLAFDAPLGFSQRVSAVVAGDTVTVVRNDEEQSTVLESASLLVMGMPSTYALIPVFFAEQPEVEVLTYDTLAFGGGSGSRQDGDTIRAMRVERFGRATLRTSDLSLVVERYRMVTDLGEGLIYARGREFLAFRSTDLENGEPFLVYRSDFFPDGVEIVD